MVASGSRSCHSNKQKPSCRAPTLPRLIDQLNKEWHISTHDCFTNVVMIFWIWLVLPALVIFSCSKPNPYTDLWHCASIFSDYRT